jgi:Amidase
MNDCPQPALELASALRRRELSAVEALAAVLDRADLVEDSLNPFAVRLDDRARRAAEAADAALAGGQGGPLCGVPLTIKDSHWLAGVTAAAGSRAIVGLLLALASALATNVAFLLKHRGGGACPRRSGCGIRSAARLVCSVPGGSRSAGSSRSSPGCCTSAR